jgi:hypothetical protein
MGLWVSGKKLPYAYDQHSASVEVSPSMHSAERRRTPSDASRPERFLP